MSYLARSAVLTNYIEVARAVGLEPYRQLREAGINRSVLLEPDTMIPVNAVSRLLERSARVAGIEDFGLRMAATRQLSNLGPLGFAVREQPTLRKALEAMGRYQRLQNEALIMRVEEMDGLAIIREDVTTGVLGGVRQGTELVLGVMYRTLGMVLGPPWRPRTVCFMHSAPASLAAHARMFGTVAFKQDFDGFVCIASDLDATIPTYDPVMAQQVRRYLDSMLLQTNATMPDKVRKLVVALLPSGLCSIDRVAQHLGVARRTVHRHLADHDDSYLSIVDAVRVELVTRYLDSSDRPLSEIATLVGFSSLSAFSRWFGARFGVSMTKRRKQHANG